MIAICEKCQTADPGNCSEHSGPLELTIHMSRPGSSTYNLWVLDQHGVTFGMVERIGSLIDLGNRRNELAEKLSELADKVTSDPIPAW